MSLTVVPFFRPAPRPRDWNNQELAEFYRVEASMIRAGMSVVTDRGLSDEGDPWFVFCRTDNEEIIVHFARIEGEYVVASPAFDECVRGNDFRPLIERLIERHPIVIARPKEGARLSIHPAALLVALVTTCFFKLGQSDAVAAEARTAKVAPPSTAGTGDARDGGGAIFTGQEATAVLTAIAAALTWTQPAIADTSADAPGLGAAAGAETGAVARIAPNGIEMVDLESASSALHHALTPSAANLDAWTEDGAPNPFLASLQTASAHAANLRSISLTALDGDGPVNAETMISGHAGCAATAATLNPHASVVTTPAPQAGETVAPASEAPNANSSAAPASAANQEIASLLGASAQSHLVTTLSADEQKLVAAAPSPATSVVVASEATPASTASASPTSSAATAPAAAASEDGRAPAEATPAPKPAAPATATLTDVNQAILHFTAQHPDFQITRLASEIIIFDSHLTLSNAASATQELFTFQDGSSIFLIGLPGAPDHGVASWL